MKAYAILVAPFSILFILNSRKIHPAYRMSTFRKLQVGFKMLLNNIRIPSASSFKIHLAMMLKILETPPEIEGSVVECGAFKGGSTSNLSLACQITGRKLLVFDSFEGLPTGDPRDAEAKYYKKGDFCGTLDEVKSNVGRWGALECCEFFKGWFSKTLPRLDGPVLLAFVDVDLEASLETCIRYIWSHLVDDGYIFIDECVGLNYCALFFSERWWDKYFSQKPPGLVGAGTGLPLGEYYIGPWADISTHPLQHASSGAYTRRGFSGYWSYEPQLETAGVTALSPKELNVTASK